MPQQAANNLNWHDRAGPHKLRPKWATAKLKKIFQTER